MNNICPKFIKPVFSGAVLKVIAIITMIIDHAALAFATGGTMERIVLRSIGRVSFPIYCFLLVEGALKTSNIKKYAVRLLIFAFISEIPFDLVAYQSPWYIDKQNVFFTLFFGLIMIWVLKSTQNNILLLLGVFGCGFGAYFLKTDYGMWGVALILAFYIATIFPQIGFLLFVVLMFFKEGREYWGLFSIIPIALYNGQRGKQIGHILYIVYPLQFILIYIIWCTVYDTSLFTF